MFMDTVQYHPTGGASRSRPSACLGQTAELVRPVGDSEGEQFVHNPDGDVTSSAIIRQCKEEVGDRHQAVSVSGWTRRWDLKNGPGTLFSVMPVQCKRYWRFIRSTKGQF